MLLAALAGTSNGAVAMAAVGEIHEFSEGMHPDSSPDTIVSGPDGNLWFSNPGGVDRIGRITMDGAVTEDEIDLPNHFMASLARGPEGNLWYVDPTKSINRYTLGGELTRFMDGPRFELRPYAIARGPDGNLWFTVRGGEPRAIGRITPTGEITEYLAGLNPGSFPYGISPGPDGNVWFTDDGTTPAIGRITPSGEITEFTADPGSTMESIAPGPDGNLWFTNRGTQAIGRITPSGVITEFSEGLGPDSRPKGITPGPDGNLWFTDRGSTDSTRAIGRITPTGEITVWRTGLNENNFVRLLTTAADGNVWFTDSGFTPAIGRIQTGQPPAVQQQPTLEGSQEVGDALYCEGEQWATWEIGPPIPNHPDAAPPGVQWLRDGRSIPGATAREYELAEADRGRSISCRAAATYPLVDVIATATSDAAVLPPPPSEPKPPVDRDDLPQGDIRTPGPPPPAPSQADPPPAFNPPSPTLRCKVAKRRALCTLALASPSRVFWLKLSRRGKIYARGRPKARGQRQILRFHRRRSLPRGRYALTIKVAGHATRQRVVLGRRN